MSSRKRRARALEKQAISLREEEETLSRRINECESEIVEQRTWMKGRRKWMDDRWTRVDALHEEVLQIENMTKIENIREEMDRIKGEIRFVEEGIIQMELGIERIDAKIRDLKLERKEVVNKALEAEAGKQSSTGSYFDKVRKVGPPSVLARVDNWRNPQESPMYLCHIPTEAEPYFPLTLVHPAFANFVDRVNSQSIDFGNEECTLVQALCDLVVFKHPGEKERMQDFNKLLGDYLQQTILPITVLNYTTDGSLVSENHMVYLTEVKPHEGNALFEAMQYYALFLSEMSELTTENTFCPCFLVELVGFQIRISGLAFFDKVACQPFTPFLHCYSSSYDKTDMDSLCRAVRALKLGVSELMQYYRSQPPAVDKMVPYCLGEKQVLYVRSVGFNLLFLVQMQPAREHRLFKFCRRYGTVVHQLWETQGLAPKLFNCQMIAGGWFVVEMEYLSDKDGWKSVYQWGNGGNKVELKQAIQNALERAHKLDEQLAHGDMRAPNIMARSMGASFQIKFVDFDWAGNVSSTFYPSFINTEEKWHPDVGPGRRLSQDHDKWWEDKWIQGGTTT